MRRTTKRSRPATLVFALAVVALVAACPSDTGVKPSSEVETALVPEIGPLPTPAEQFGEVDPQLAELGKMLFFDVYLSGDAAISCATCHDPTKGWGDGQPLSKAYPGSEYFRNSKTLLNAAYARYFYWDGRLSGKDRETLVRDSITETHFLNMDGRLMLERLKQVPEYDKRFKKILGGEPSFGRTLKAIGAFLTTVVSTGTPFDQGKLSESAARGRELFEGKAGCVRCHSGPYFSDAKAHATGVPENPDVLENPMRHITMRSFYKFMGVPNFENEKTDVGFYTVTKTETDRGKFLTPTLRELVHTAPYMHNGTIGTLAQVVDFYDAGAGEARNKSPLLRPLGLTAEEKADLIAFLESLSGDALIVEAPQWREYEAIPNWTKTEN